MIDESWIDFPIFFSFRSSIYTQQMRVLHFQTQSRQLANSLFEIDWFALGKNVQRDLLMITRRSAIPIEFSSVYVIPMNLDSFVGVRRNSVSVHTLMSDVNVYHDTITSKALDNTFLKHRFQFASILETLKWFLQLLKTSYSTYNIMRNSSKCKNKEKLEPYCWLADSLRYVNLVL